MFNNEPASDKKKTVENMTDEIYSAIEVNSEINLNINLQNKTTGNRQENKVSTSNIFKIRG